MVWGLIEPGSFGDFFLDGDYVGWREELQRHYETEMTDAERAASVFWPIRILTPKGADHPTPHFGMVVRRFLDAFSPKHSDPAVEGLTLASANGDDQALNRAIQNALTEAGNARANLSRRAMRAETGRFDPSLVDWTGGLTATLPAGLFPDELVLHGGETLPDFFACQCCVPLSRWPQAIRRKINSI